MISKRFDLIYFCGDSWTHARNAEGVMHTACLEEETFYYLVAKNYNLPYVKSAKGGAGNKWIHNRIYIDIPELKKKYTNILSIVGWSDPDRIEIFDNKQKQINNISSPPFSREFDKLYLDESYDFSSTYYFDQTCIYIKSARALYSALNIGYIDAIAFRPENPLELKVDFLGEGKILEKTYLDICGDEGRIYMPKIKGYGHQNNLGQQKIATALIEKIEELYGPGQP